MGIVAGAAAAATSIDCDTPDDFCTGDPCVPGDELAITVSSCVLDFSPRTLRLERQVRVPNGGTLSLTAGEIVVNRAIDGQHISVSEPNGATIDLTATGGMSNIGQVLVQARIDASGRASTGAINLTAPGPIGLALGSLRSRARGRDATATGGTVTINSGDNVTITRKIDVRGRRAHTAGGSVAITAALNVIAVRPAKVDARGFPGGSIALTSASASVGTTDELRAQGWTDGAGGTVNATAAVDMNLARADVSGGLGGGTITLLANGTLTAERLKARGLAGPAGSIGLTAGTVNALATLDARGSAAGGTIDIQSTVGDVAVHRIDARGLHGPGGMVTMDAVGNGAVDTGIVAQGDTGGEIRITTGGDLALGADTSSDVDASGVGGGVVEAQAGGDLTARGDFAAAAGGCIGLSAAGVLDTSNASFDVPLTASCP